MGSGLVELVQDVTIHSHCLFYHSISAVSEYIAAILTKLKCREVNMLVIWKSEDDSVQK